MIVSCILQLVSIQCKQRSHANICESRTIDRLVSSSALTSHVEAISKSSESTVGALKYSKAHIQRFINLWEPCETNDGNNCVRLSPLNRLRACMRCHGSFNGCCCCRCHTKPNTQIMSFAGASRRFLASFRGYNVLLWLKCHTISASINHRHFNGVNCQTSEKQNDKNETKKT